MRRRKYCNKGGWSDINEEKRKVEEDHKEVKRLWLVRRWSEQEESKELVQEEDNPDEEKKISKKIGEVISTRQRKFWSKDMLSDIKKAKRQGE